jgi:hypothetical protein
MFKQKYALLLIVFFVSLAALNIAAGSPPIILS